VRVNFIEYWEVSEKKVQHCSWVTDLRVTKDNIYKLMRGGRARWKIENETFNTLKNQGTTSTTIMVMASRISRWCWPH